MSKKDYDLYQCLRLLAESIDNLKEAIDRRTDKTGEHYKKYIEELVKIREAGESE